MNTTTHPLDWCLHNHRRGLDGEIFVTLYRRGENMTDFELGVALFCGHWARYMPLTYVPDAAQPGPVYEAYSALADDYVNYLKTEGLPVRRVWADFEPRCTAHAFSSERRFTVA